MVKSAVGHVVPRTHLSNILVQQAEGVAHIEVLPVQDEGGTVPLPQRLYQFIYHFIILPAPHTLLHLFQVVCQLYILYYGCPAAVHAMVLSA